MAELVCRVCGLGFYPQHGPGSPVCKQLCWTDFPRKTHALPVFLVCSAQAPRLVCSLQGSPGMKPEPHQHSGSAINVLADSCVRL